MDQKAINVIRNLALDMIQVSNQGHPGITMDAAPIFYTLFAKNLKVNPAVCDWINRDRVIVSTPDAAELLYSTMFFSGYPFLIDDMKQYRKLNSKTPGIPSIKTEGVDCNSGYSGEGLATAVGIALAEKIYEEKYNYKSKGIFDKVKLDKLFDYYTYVIVSDGDLMEGVSYEAASFAGTYKLGKLIVLYDSNDITEDGVTKNTFTEDVLGRFASCGWDTQFVKNGTSVSEINNAIKKAKKEVDRPSIIKIKTIIGEGLPNQGTNLVHENNLTKEEINIFKEKTNAGDIPFAVLKEPASYMRDQVVNRGISEYEKWEKLFEEYKKILTQEQLIEIDNIKKNKFEIDLTKVDFQIDFENKELLRDSNHRVMNAISSRTKTFIGGSADAASSTRTYMNNQGDLNANNLLGKNIYFGVREHLMGAVLNGLALSGFRPYGSTQMAFVDYLKPSIRMSAIMNLPVTYIFTHDSITSGSDGPTHQPVEALASLRAMPNLYVFRPADIKEIIGTWNYILNKKIPAVISLPKTEVKAEQGTNITGVYKGAYIAGKEQTMVNAVIIATGSELQVAKSIQIKLLHLGIDVRIVSMPCMELYNMQDEDYKNELFPLGIPIFVIEYESSFGWEKFVPSSEYLFNVNNFGIPASKDDNLNYLKIDIDSIVSKIEKLISYS